MPKKIYVGVPVDAPVYEELNDSITGSNIEEYFTVVHHDGSGFIDANNTGTFTSALCEHSSSGIAKTTLTALRDMSITVDFVYTLSSHDAFSVTLADIGVIDLEGGEEETTKTFSGTVLKGQVIEVNHIRINFDMLPFICTCSFSIPQITYLADTGEVEQKQIAHETTKSYIGIEGVAKKIKKAYIGVNGKAQLCWGQVDKINVTISVGSNVTGVTYTVTESDGTQWQGSTTKTTTIQVNCGASISYSSTKKSNSDQYKYTWLSRPTSSSNIQQDTTVEFSVYMAPQYYTVTFKDWDGTVLKTQSVQWNQSATPPSDPTREGYVFNGWSGSYTNVTANTTVTATYKTATTTNYTVTFKDWDGTVLKTQSVPQNGSATPPPDPTRESSNSNYYYVFNGWSGSYTNVTANTTVTATYNYIHV